VLRDGHGAPGYRAEAAQILAERRRAARAAAANAVPGRVATPAFLSARPSPDADPRWNQMDQAYRERAATAGARPTNQ
jgi:hypothetical protein